MCYIFAILYSNVIICVWLGFCEFVDMYVCMCFNLSFCFYVFMSFCVDYFGFKNMCVFLCLWVIVFVFYFCKCFFILRCFWKYVCVSYMCFCIGMFVLSSVLLTVCVCVPEWWSNYVFVWVFIYLFICVCLVCIIV